MKALKNHYEDKVNFKNFDVTIWLTNNFNKYIAQHPRNQGKHLLKCCSVSFSSVYVSIWSAVIIDY